MNLPAMQETWVRSGYEIRKTSWRRKWQPTPVFLPGKSDRGDWQATVHGFMKELDVT